MFCVSYRFFLVIRCFTYCLHLSCTLISSFFQHLSQSSMLFQAPETALPLRFSVGRRRLVPARPKTFPGRPEIPPGSGTTRRIYRILPDSFIFSHRTAGVCLKVFLLGLHNKTCGNISLTWFPSLISINISF